MKLLTSQKPAHTPTPPGPLTQPTTTTTTCATTPIPPSLSFENVICNHCAPPCALQDFLNYLIYIAHDAEPLQFYLWMVDYHQRFRGAREEEKARAPVWRGSGSVTQEGGTGEVGGGRQEGGGWGVEDVDVHSIDISSVASEWGAEGELSAGCGKGSEVVKITVTHVEDLEVPSRMTERVDQGAAGQRGQPFRAEIDRIIEHYLAEGAPRALDLAREDFAAVLEALRYTTHPSALNVVKRMVDARLRNVSHPNFVRWSICNGNKQWTLGLRIFALTNITLGFLIAILLTLSHHSRYWRIFAAIEWWFGITNLIAASQGLCVLLHRMHTRQQHVWETTNHPLEDDERRLKGHLDIDYLSYEDTKPRWPVKMEVFGPANEYGSEDWVQTYPRKPWFRKLFEKRIEVKDPGLRGMQDRMVRQAEAWAFLVTILLTVGFCAIPPANLF